MKKSVVLALVMFVLLGMVFYLGFLDGSDSKKSSANIADRAFAVDDPSEVNALRITQKNAPLINLKKVKGKWRVNDKYEADQNTIFNLLEVINTCRMDFIPNKSAYTNIVEEIGRIGILVEVFDKKDNKLKGYYVGGNTPKEESTYFLMEGEKQPYAVVIPGVIGGVRNRFQVTELKIRDKHVFKDLKDQISQIKVEYPNDKSIGFMLTRAGDNYAIKDLHPSTKIIDKELNNKLAETYFKEFDKLASEWIENDNPRRDSIVNNMIPFSNISILLKDGSEQSLSLFPMNDVIDPDIITIDLESLEKVERYFGETSWGDFYLIQHRLIKGILRPYEYFFQGS